MVILVVGNGFDIAHGLSTQYSDFLDFYKLWHSVPLRAPKASTNIWLQSFMDQIRKGTEPIFIEAREILSKENKLLEYYLAIYEDRCKAGKKGWIDFEAEISDIVKALDTIHVIEENAKTQGSTNFKIDPYLQDTVRFLFEKKRGTNNYYSHLCNSGFPMGFFDEPVNMLLDDLNNLTRLFEIYLTEYIEKCETVKRIPEIYELRESIDALITFNYTDTYQRLYQENRDVKYCYIHGKAEKESSVESCSIVIGIDEYLTDERKDNDNAFVWFKKFYQRIYKNTNSKYMDWLEEDRIINKGNKEKLPLYIYFYGHSLDKTDKDMLNRLIMYENAEVRIFYHNREALSSQINNLIKVIGEDNLIHMTRGKDRKITFLPCSPAMDTEKIEEEHKKGKRYFKLPMKNRNGSGRCFDNKITRDDKDY